MKDQSLLIPIQNTGQEQDNIPVVFGDYTYPDTRRKFISKVEKF